MKRIILSLAVFLFAAAARGQVGIPPGVIFGNPTPGAACVAGPGQIVTSTGQIYTCPITNVWTSFGSLSSWGGISGTLSNQTDLQTALNGKASSTASMTINSVPCSLSGSCTVTAASLVPTGVWSSGTSYSSGAMILYNPTGLNYACISGCTAGVTPITAANWMQISTPVPGVISDGASGLISPGNITSGIHVTGIVAANVIGWWPTWDGSGSTATELASGNNLTLTNVTWSGAQGVITNMLTFNGTTASAQAGSATSFNFDGHTTPFSASAWVSTTSTAANNIILTNLSNNSSFIGWSFILTNHADSLEHLRLFVSANNSTNNYLDVASSNTCVVPADASLHQVGFTYTGSSNVAGVTFYLDGVACTGNLTTRDTLTSATTASGNFYVGAQIHSGGSSFFHGNIGDVIVTNNALSPSLMASLFSSPYPALFGTTGVTTLTTNGITFPDGSKQSTAAGTGKVVPGSYTFYVSGGTVYAQNNTTGAIDYSGSDAAVVINNVLAALSTVGGKLYFKDGIYPLNTLTAETKAGWTTYYYGIGIPSSSITGWVQWHFEGEARSAWNWGADQYQATAIQNTGVIFLVSSTALAGVSSTNMAMGVFQRPDPSNTYSNEDYFKNITVRMPSGAEYRGNVTGIALWNASALAVENVIADFNDAYQSIARNASAPVAGTLGSFGITGTYGSLGLPQRFTANAAVGWDIGYDWNEHTISIGDDAFFDNHPWEIGRGGPNMLFSGKVYHSSLIQRFQDQENAAGPIFGATMQAGSRVDMPMYDIEFGNGGGFWFQNRTSGGFSETNAGNTSGTIDFLAVTAVVGSVSGLPLFSSGGTAFTVCTGKTCQYPTMLVSALPTCNAAAKGTQATVSDASSPTFLATVTGGSTTLAPVTCNGTNWVAY